MPFPKTRAEMRPELYFFERNAVCSGCHQRIEFWQTPGLKSIPMDPMPADDSPAVAHWATCPYSNRFKKGKR